MMLGTHEIILIKRKNSYFYSQVSSFHKFNLFNILGA
jgi:hypothetical protein